MVDAKNGLGDYLKARRQLVTPETVGLPRGTRRRVPGLRREELALLAGISPDYYLRLEQGRDNNPSPQVLDALAGILQLDSDARKYLYQLVRDAPSLGPREQVEIVPAGTAQMIDQLPLPTFVQGRLMDILAANPLARALSPQYRPGVNPLRTIFFDSQDRALHLDWERATEDSVAGLRAIAGADLQDPALERLVEELSAKSERFRELWARQDVLDKSGGTSRLMHPRVGLLELRHERFAVSGTDGQIMVIFHADPGSRSQAALEELRRTIPGERAG